MLPPLARPNIPEALAPLGVSTTAFQKQQAPTHCRLSLFGVGSPPLDWPGTPTHANSPPAYYYMFRLIHEPFCFLPPSLVCYHWSGCGPVFFSSFGCCGSEIHPAIFCFTVDDFVPLHDLLFSRPPHLAAFFYLHMPPRLPAISLSNCRPICKLSRPKHPFFLSTMATRKTPPTMTTHPPPSSLTSPMTN